MKKTLMYTLWLSASALSTSAIAREEATHQAKQELESLGSIVTSVSRKPEDSFRAAAAIYVITNEDIKLSGATHIAEALRGVPGLDVARFDSSNWAISSRGFNAFFANKLLVQVDGRTIYTPWFSGVYWDIQNLPLEDIDRIEVIRGPGATQWGANAVNGIINIITKNSADTQGLQASAAIGNLDHAITNVRYGGKLGDNAYYRAYGEFTDRADTQTINSGPSGHNDWYNGKAGFRSDWDVSSDRKVTLQGDAYNAHINLDLLTPSLTGPGGVDFSHDKIRSRGMNMLGRWEEKHDEALQSTFQTYFDYQSPDYSALKQDIYTLDFDYQTVWNADDRNDVMWGGGVRYIDANVQGSPSISVVDKTQSILNVFLQDQFAVIPQEVYLTVGSKFEHNSFSGFELEPSVRVAWYPDNKQTLWAAVSRAVRTPSVFEGNDNMALDALAIPPDMLQQRGSGEFDSEDLVAYEIGYRVKPVQSINIDATAFINDYRNLATLEPGAPDGVYLPYYFSNLGAGRAYGFETTTTWDVLSNWNLLANYSYINLVLDAGASQDFTFMGQEGNVPHHQFMLRSQLFLPHDVQLINTGYFVDNLPNANVDAYLRFDTQVIWKATENVELALVGQNLLDNKHPEFSAPPDGQANEIPRAFYGRVTFRY